MVFGACAAPAPYGREVLNDVCPRSGKPVASDSLTTYRGFTVGFCNPHCRDDFAAHPEDCAADRACFDRLIGESVPRRE
ncbi:MAG: YHS domain-containing protein [Planctomycetes bacterium]|nr:YHS domain-containing protein [Planctomycetota bacterium]